MGHDMNGHIRPSLAFIRVWFFLVVVMAIVSAMALYDLDIGSMTYDARGTASSSLSSR